MSTRQSLRRADMEPCCGRCTICDSDAWTALWHGASEILICWPCAREVLPRLIADATRRPGMPLADAEAQWTRATAEYWRAVAICQMRDQREAVTRG